MPKFTLYHDYEFLMYSYDLRYTNTILVMKANEGHRGNIKLDFSPIASIHHREGQAAFNELEIYGVVISGHHLQQLTQQLLDRAILVNHQGLCLTKLREAYEVYIPLHDIFNWSKYGVTDVPYPPRDSWSGSSSVVTVFRDPRYNLDSVDKLGTIYPDDQSKEIRLSGDDMFISSKCGGVLLLWKVDSPSGDIKNVRFMGMIDSKRDMSRLEVNGVTLQGGIVQVLCTEIRGQFMINAKGWCLVYVGDPMSFYYRIVSHFDWHKYGVKTDSSCSSAWGPDRRYLNEVETVTEFVFPPPKEIIICSQCDEYEVQVKELEERLKQKQQELEDCRGTLEKKEEEISCYQRHLGEKDREVKDLELELEKVNTRLCAKQSKAINALQIALDSLINPEEC